MTHELPYVELLRKKHGIDMKEKSRFVLRKEFEGKIQSAAAENKKDAQLFHFRLLKKIDDLDEK